MGCVENVWGFRAFVVLWHWYFKRERGKVLTDDCGCIKQLAYISSLESINVVAVAFLNKAELHFSWSDTAAWCWQLLHHQQVFVLTGDCCSLSEFGGHRADVHLSIPFPPSAWSRALETLCSSVWGLPFRNASTCTDLGKNCSHMSCFLLGCTSCGI